MYQHSAINTARLNNLKVIIILSVLLWEKKPKYYVITAALLQSASLSECMQKR